jgi:hypothetical protein
MRLGIDLKDLNQKQKQDLIGQDNSAAAELRYKNYLKRFEATIKSVHDERKEILKHGNG